MHKKSLKIGDKIAIILDHVHCQEISRYRCLPSHFVVQPHRRILQLKVDRFVEVNQSIECKRLLNKFLENE